MGTLLCFVVFLFPKNNLHKGYSGKVDSMKVTSHNFIVKSRYIRRTEARSDFVLGFSVVISFFYVYRYRTTSTPVSSKTKAMEQVNSRAYNFRKYERYNMPIHRLPPGIKYHEFSILFAS